jgi:hypothetical protein
MIGMPGVGAVGTPRHPAEGGATSTAEGGAAYGGGATPTSTSTSGAAGGADPASAIGAVQARGSASKTMLGVALPGIAPLAATAPAAAPAPGPHATEANAPHRPMKTMLGVATPGIAPLDPTRGPAAAPPTPMAAAKRPQPPLVPAPLPLVEEPLPAPPARAVKRGVPLAAVAGIALALVLAFGGALALLLRGGGKLTAEPALDPEGREVLRLSCDSCADETVASLGTSRTVFRAHEAMLALSTPLNVGDNELRIHLDRPGTGRDEEVKLTVPLSYRIRTEPTALQGSPPKLLVRAEAQPGTELVLGGAPLPLDERGRGELEVSLEAETSGVSAETKVIERALPYEVTPPSGRTERGDVRARVVVVPLVVDAPSSTAVVTEERIIVAGRSARGARVEVAGEPASSTEDGSFERELGLTSLGENVIPLRAHAPPLAPRTFELRIVRVASLEDAAKDFLAKAPAFPGYDAAVRDLTEKAGTPPPLVSLEGEVIETRSASRQTILLVDERRGCATPPCIARVVVGAGERPVRGDRVRAFGRFTRVVSTSSGSKVPELEADFVMKLVRPSSRR